MPPKTEKSSVRPITKAKSAGKTNSDASSSSSSFEGFSPKTIEFFTKLKKNNVREWFKANLDYYTKHVSTPMTLLADALKDDFGQLKVYRPYRDVRFGVDKTPIKDHVAMSGPGAGKQSCGGNYFHVKEEEYLLAVGIYLPDSKQLEKFRQLVTIPAEARKIHALLNELKEHGFVLNDDGKLTSAPKGYKKDDPEIELLRLKSLAVCCKRPIDDDTLFDGAACLNMVKDGWTAASKWSQWLDAHVA